MLVEVGAEVGSEAVLEQRDRHGVVAHRGAGPCLRSRLVVEVVVFFLERKVGGQRCRRQPGARTRSDGGRRRQPGGRRRSDGGGRHQSEARSRSDGGRSRSEWRVPGRSARHLYRLPRT